MSDRTTNGTALISETVGRLRSVQEDFADEPADVRQQHLREELDRALSRLVPNERQTFLNEVLRRFPSWDDAGNGHAVAAATAAESTAAQASDPETLAQRLIDAAADLQEDRRAALRGRLAEAGLAGSSGAAWPQDVAAQLKLPAGATVTPERALHVLAVLLASAEKIDDMAWKTLRQLDRQGARRKPGELKNAIISYITGESAGGRSDTRATSKDITERVELSRRLASSLIYELREIETFAKQQAERFSVEKIEMVAGGDQKMLEGLTAACWRTFKKIASDYDAAAVEREIRQRIAQHVEENLR